MIHGTIGWSALRWLTVPAAAALALLSIERGFDGSDRLDFSSSRDIESVSLAGLPKTYSESLKRLDIHRDGAVGRAKALDDGWLIHDIAARAWFWRARLTGDYEDYAAAQGALERSFARAAPGTGPHMTGVSLSFSMHRLSEAERYLDIMEHYAVPPGPADRAEMLAIRGDIAFYRGDYTMALATYDAADRMSASTTDYRRAVYYAHTGRPDLAEDYYDKVERDLPYPSAQARSKLELQRGILDLDRGRWDEALAHFRKADRMFPGHWLIEEHIAEVMALKGDLAGAEKLYLGIVRRTGHPEFMDALAGIAARRGDDAAAAGWTRRADAEWRERLRLFPQAAYGHALDHCVQKGDWRCALDLARRNHQARPYGEAKIALAEALLHNGRIPEARSVIEAVLASPWRTAELHTVAAEIYNAAGDASKVGEQRGLAFAINPHALENVPLPRSTEN